MNDSTTRRKVLIATGSILGFGGVGAVAHENYGGGPIISSAGDDETTTARATTTTTTTTADPDTSTTTSTSQETSTTTEEPAVAEQSSTTEETTTTTTDETTTAEETTTTTEETTTTTEETTTAEETTTTTTPEETTTEDSGSGDSRYYNNELHKLGEESGIDVVTVGTTNSVTSITYRTSETEVKEGEVPFQLESAIAPYFDLVDDGWQSKRLEIRILNDDSEGLDTSHLDESVVSRIRTGSPSVDDVIWHGVHNLENTSVQQPAHPASLLFRLWG